VGVERAAGGVFDFGEGEGVRCSTDDFAKGDARGEPEEFFACQHLPGELIEEGEALPVGAVAAEPGDGVTEDARRNDAAGDGGEDLQPWHALEEDFEAA